MSSCKRFFHWFFFFCASTILWGCLEYSITTQVMPDGRMLRTIIVKGDSTDIFRGSFRVPSDSSWAISTRLESRSDKDVNEGKVYVYEARKEFKNFQELNQQFYNDSSFNDHIAIHVNLERRFNWFYYHYRYTETYGKLFPFLSVPITNYLSDAELRIHQSDDKDIYYSPDHDSLIIVKDTLNLPVLSKKDSLRFKSLHDTLEAKFELWQKINIYNEFYHVVTVALKKLHHQADTLAARKSFYNFLDSEKTFETGIENDDAFVNAASTYFNVNPEKLQAANPGGFDNFKKKFRVAAYSLETYTNRVLMPGMIIRTNAGKTDINEASWTFKIDNFYASDYTMTVESRIVNKWFVTIAGAVVVVILALILIRLFRK